MRRILVLVVAVPVMVLGLAVPAGADRPFEDSFSITFLDTNPCTEGPMEVTLNFVASVHAGHPNNFVVTVQRTGSAEPGGYTMVSGSETFVANRGVEKDSFNDVWRNDEGSMFRAWGVFVDNANQDEVKVDRFRLQCIRA